MCIRKITENYRITIPSKIRENLNLEEGDYVKVREEDGKIILEKYEKERENVELERELSVDEIEEDIRNGM